MTIRIYGTGCTRCHELADNTQTALDALGMDVEPEKVTSLDAIVARGIISTPALEVDGEILVSGSVPSPAEIAKLLGAKGGPAESSCGCNCGCSCGCGGNKKKSSAFKRFLAWSLAIVAFAGVLIPLLRDAWAKPAAVYPSAQVTTNDTVTVYYFHGNRRCMTCNKIEGRTLEVIQTTFAKELDSGRLVFKSVNIEAPENEHFVKDFALATRTVVIARGASFERFDGVWQYVHEDAKFADYITSGISKFMTKEKQT